MLVWGWGDLKVLGQLIQTWDFPKTRSGSRCKQIRFQAPFEASFVKCRVRDLVFCDTEEAHRCLRRTSKNNKTHFPKQHVCFSYKYVLTDSCLETQNVLRAFVLQHVSFEKCMFCFGRCGSDSFDCLRRYRFAP